MYIVAWLISRGDVKEGLPIYICVIGLDRNGAVLS